MDGLTILIGLAIFAGLVLLYWLVRLILTEEFFVDD